jgi:hypothetical protein
VVAEVTIDLPDFGRLEPIVNGTERELAPSAQSLPGARRRRRPLAQRRMENVVGPGAQVQIPPRAGRQSATSLFAKACR